MTTQQLQNLCDELTEVAPPPPRPLGLNTPVVAGGKWIAVRFGGGAYAIRAQYQTVDGKTITVKMEDEIRGFPNGLISAIRFTINLAKSHRLYWVAV